MSVRLRELTQADGARVLGWRNSPDVAPYMYSDHEITPEEHDRWLKAALSSPDRRYWTIELDGHPVGLANIVRIDVQNSRCDWAYYLADPSTRGRGVGACVEYIVLGHVFETLGLNKLWCEVLLENEAVWKLHEAYGFVREALFREHVMKGGRFLDVVGLGMLKRDWPAAKAKAGERLAAKGYELAELRIG